MNKILGFSTVFLVSVQAVRADVYNGYYNNFSGQEVVVESGGVLNSVSGITLSQYTEINNAGTINASIDTGSFSLSVRNSGDFNGIITIGAGQQLSQLIRKNNEITRLNVANISATNYKIDISNAEENLKLDALKNLEATVVEINNSKLIIDDFADWRNWAADVRLVNTELIITNPYSIISGEKIIYTDKVSGIKVTLQDVDKLYKVSYASSGGVWKIYLSRETNYEKIFNDSRGTLLKSIRTNNPDDKLLKKMDSATNMAELKSIMDKSYRFNRGILANPIKTINNFSMMNLIDDDNDFKIGVNYILSDKMKGTSGRLNINNRFDNLLFNIGFNINRFSYSDDINDFDGFVYGLDMKSAVDISNVKIKNNIGFNIISFNTGDLIVDNDIKNNPNGYSLYDAFDIEHKSYVYGGLSVLPFVGANIQYRKILDYSGTDFNLRGGGNIKYDYVMDSMKYEYIGGLAITHKGEGYLSLKLGFVSLSDNAGGTIGCDILKTDDNISYKLSVNGKINF